MLDLKLEVAQSALAHADTLKTIQNWTAQEPSARPSLSELLRSQVKTIAQSALKNRHFNQVELACEDLDGFRAPARRKASVGPTSHVARDVAANRDSNLPWFLRCLIRVAEELLCDDRGRISLRWDNLASAQRLLRVIEPAQLSAVFHVQRRRTTGMPARSIEQSDTEVIAWADDALLPPVCCNVLASLDQRGLVEPHRHMNISLQPILIWGRLMQCDRLPDGLSEQVKKWLIDAQQIRGQITKMLSARMLGGAPRSPLRTWLNTVLKTSTALLETELPATRSDWCLPPARWDVTSSSFERQLLFRLFEWLFDEPGEELAACAHAYCVLQNLVYSELVMQVNNSDGLDRFTTLFGAHPLRDDVDKESPQRLVQAYRTGRVYWLEARLTPGKDAAERIYGLRDSFSQRMQEKGKPELLYSDLEPAVNLLARQIPAHDLSLPAMGIIFHFVKYANDDKSGTTEDWQRPIGAREHQRRSEAWDQADRLAELLQTDPLAARLIVGFDVCGSEAKTEMGTFAPQLRYLRQHGRPPMGTFALGRKSPEKWYRDTRMFLTCHAGEDFNHLLGGLRHVDEALVYYQLHDGDRIGHATALGISPLAWMKRAGGTCFLRQGQWLDDLVWFHEWLAWCGGDNAVRHQVAQRIAELSGRIYRKPIEAAELFAAWALRGEDPGEPFPEWKALSYPELGLCGGRYYARECLRQHGQERSFELWRRYHLCPTVRREYERVIEVPLDQRWADAIGGVQRALTEKVIAQRVVIEINPSSNLTLGPIDDMVEHPVFKWLDPRNDFDAAQSPLIVVGTDDPSTFGTELIHEYAFLARAAEELGATHRQIQAWLEHLRRSGIDFSFLPRESFMGSYSQVALVT